MENNDLTPEEPDQEKVPVLVKSDSGPPTVHHISKRDRDVVDSFVSSGSVAIAAKECHMEQAGVRAVIGRPELQQYIADRFRRSADRYDISEDKIMSKLNLVLESDGKTKYDASFMKAIEVAAKILKLIQPNNLNIGVQVNNNPYKELSDEELDSVMRERISGTKPQTQQ